LLTLMTKVQLLQQRDQIGGLRAKASQQYADRDLSNALQTYQELLGIDPRNEEARHMSAKIRIQLGLAAYKNARESISQKLYAQAIKQFQEAIRYGYERQKSERGIQDAERMAQSAQEERHQSARARSEAAHSNAAPAGVPAAAPAAAPAMAAPPVVTAEAAAEANTHYRESLAAIRSKDYHRAIEECEIASQLNPGDEHIYVACQRAKQEWAAANAGRAQ
jgi:tetratricopeptide (TPR) repeat protein